MICSTHIIECLRAQGVEPEASSRSIAKDEFNATNALIYDAGTEFRSGESNIPQWWSVNFKQPVLIGGHQIVVESQSHLELDTLYFAG